MSSRDLFSIDVDAHLRKAATHTFSSSAHYPVELVRAALRRGATRVDVVLDNNRVSVRDNGKGFYNDAIDTLVCIMDPGQPVHLKEEAVEKIQTPEGYGLLAMFAPSPQRILVETVSETGTTRLDFQKGKLNRSTTCSLKEGTAITLTTGPQKRDIAHEKKILFAYCRAVSIPIYLNSKMISGGALLSGQLATKKISPRRAINGGIIGIPTSGDLCRIRLMEYGIPHRYVTVPAHKGFIFDAAVEYRGEVTFRFLDYLAESAHQLYMWLCKHHGSASSETKNRIEDLIFNHCRLTEDQSFLPYFSPFKGFRSDTYYSMEQLTGDGAASIFAVPLNKEKLRYHIGSRRVLALTREQADFLINIREIPITFLSPVFSREKKWPRLIYSFKQRLKRLMLALLREPPEGKIIQNQHLDDRQLFFLDRLNAWLSRSGDFAGKAVMIASNGPFPAVLTGKSTDPTGTRCLMVRQKHPIIKKAIEMVRKNDDNIEMVIPLLLWNEFR